MKTYSHRLLFLPALLLGLGLGTAPARGATQPNAWQIDAFAASVVLNYSDTLNPDQKSAATNVGWRFTVISRLTAGSATPAGNNPAQFMTYGHGDRRFIVGWDANAAGQLTATLYGSGDVRTNLTAPGRATNDYHTHELVYDPATTNASYLFDGAIVRTWPGNTPDANYNGAVLWGAAASGALGRMNYHRVQFSTNLANPGLVSEYFAGITGQPASAPSPPTQGWTLTSSTPTGTMATNFPVSPDALNAPGVDAYRLAVLGEPALVGYYPVDGDIAPSLTDRRLPVQNGTLVSNAVIVTGTGTGAVGTHALQGGVTTMGFVPEYQFSNGVGTVEAFLYQTNTSPSGINPCYFSVRGAGGTRYSLHGNGGGTNVILLWNGVSNIQFLTPLNMLTQRVHVAVVFTNGTATAYFNGGSLGSQNFGLGTPLNQPSQIGASTAANTEPWPGRIDEVAVYTNAQSYQTIATRVSMLMSIPPDTITFTTQPVSRTALALQTATFNVAAESTIGLTLSYQWRRNGIDLPGANSPTLTFGPLVPADDGAFFSCRVSTPGGANISASATLTVLNPNPPHLLGVRADSTFTRVTLSFDNLLQPSSAQNSANYSIPGLTIVAAALDGTARNVVLTTSPQTEGQGYTITISNVREATGLNALDPNPSLRNFSALVFSSGSIQKGFYASFGGNNVDPFVAAVQADATMPDNTCLTNLFEFNAADMADNYGGRMAGYFMPLESGSYTFYLASAGPGRLFLSADSNPAGVQEIAREPVGAGRREWTGLGPGNNRGGPANISAAINLVAGHRYFIESFFTAGVGADHMAVAVRPPGAPVPVNGSSPIAGSIFGVYADPAGATLSINSQPLDRVIVENQFAMFTVGATGSSPLCGGSLFYQWRKNGVNIPGANGPSLLFGPASLADDASRFDCVIFVPGFHQSSTVAQLTVISDTEGPVFTHCPADLVLALPPLSNSVAGEFAPAVTDNSGTNGVVINCTPPSGTYFPIGTTPVSCTATDAAGNSSAPCKFRVIVGLLEFSLVASGLAPVSFGTVAWGDYDSDGWLDLVLSGGSAGGRITQVWRNQGNNTFSDINAGLPGLDVSTAAWGDYDNDGRLDLALAGSSAGGRVTQIWRNTGSGFNNIVAGLTGVDDASLAWGDYDRDGRPDLLLTGFTGGARVAQVWRNTGGSFSNINAGLTGLSTGGAAWGDFDRDGRLDIVLTGLDGSSARRTELWRNTDAGFALEPTGFPGVSASAVAWGDFDNDGWPDLALAGNTGSQPIAQVWRNTGGSFSNINAGLPGVSECSVAWGDYDNDGKADLLLTGTSSGGPLSQIWRSTGSNFVLTPPGLTPVRIGRAAWGDYDNDGRLDVALMGLGAGSVRAAEVWHNNFAGATNNVPTAPTGLVAAPIGGGVQLRWNAATDAQTPARGLSYNLAVGTSAGGITVLSPQANMAGGWRRLPALGNTQSGTNATLDLPPGTYFWAVQSVDGAWASSPFTTGGSFVVSQAVHIIAYEKRGPNQFWIEFSGAASTAYRVESSQDLQTWTDRSLATPTTPGHYEFTDNAAPATHRFYRAVLP